MATVTLRPNGTNLTQDTVTIGGGAASHHAATSDNSDATYTELGGATGIPSVWYDLATFVLPPLAQIRSLTPRIRAWRSFTNNDSGIRFRWGMNFTGWKIETMAISGTITTYTGAAKAVHTSTGAPWTQADIDAAVFHVSRGVPASDTYRAYEVYLDVVYNEAPVVVVSAPTEGGTIATTTRPTVSWTYTDPEGDAQERYRVKVFSAAQYGAAGFSPETSVATWDSGEVLSSATSVTVGVDLSNTTTYRAYVKASDADSSARYSLWDNNTFTVTIAGPAVPSVAAHPNTTGRIVGNLLTATQESLEDGSAGWAAGTNATIAASTAHAVHGGASLAIGAIAAGTNVVTTPTGLSGVPVSPLTAYTVVGWARAATVARAVKLDVLWYSAAGAYLGISTPPFNNADTPDGWTAIQAVATAPATAAFAALNVSIVAPAAGEVHYLDLIGLVKGSTVTYLPESRVAVAVQGRDNALTLNQSSLETDTTGWNVQANATLTRSTAQAAHGVASLSMAAVAAGASAANAGTPQTPVAPGHPYVASAQLRAATAGRKTRIDIRWLTAGLATISTTVGPDVVDTTTGWTEIRAMAVSPSNAALAMIIVRVEDLAQVAGEVHYVDKISLAPGSLNMLSEQDASLEDAALGVGSWGVGVNWGNATLARSTAHAAEGLASLAMTSGGAGPAMDTAPGRYATGIPVVAGRSYSARTSVRAATTGRSCSVGLIWTDAANAIISQTFGAGVDDSASGWTTLSATFAAPTGAVRVSLVVQVGGTPPTGEVHYVDAVQLTEGSAPAWEPGYPAWSGGTNYSDPSNAYSLTVERSTDGGVTWATVRGASALQVTANQRATVYDYEAPQDKTTLYRVKAVRVALSQSIASAWSAVDSALLLATAGVVWIKSPSDPTASLVITHEETRFASTSTEQQGVFYAAGRPTPIVIAGTVQAEVFEALRLFFRTDAQWEAFEKLRKRAEPLLFQSCYGDSAPEQYWLRLGPDRTVTRITYDNMGTEQLRRVVVGAREVAAPAV